MDPENSKIYIGPAGWHYKDWYGPFYPQNHPKGFKELDYLAEYFNTAEINSTFYRPANSFMGAAWVRKVSHNPDFLFTAKLWKNFTHKKDEFTKQEVQTFYQGIDPLMQHGKLGALLCQFPWSFKAGDDTKQRIKKITASFSQFPLIFEFRHLSWDDPEIKSFISELGAGIASVDQPVIGKSLSFKPETLSSIGYVRLHGRNYNNWFVKAGSGQTNPSARYDYLYTEQELGQIKEVVKKVNKKAGKTFVIFNNHPWGQAIINSLQLKAALGENITLPPSVQGNFLSGF